MSLRTLISRSLGLDAFTDQASLEFNSESAVSADFIAARRKFLFGGSLLAAIVAAGERKARAGDPPSAEKWLVDRLTMGVTLAELAQAQTLGYSDYLEYQLAFDQIVEDPALLARLANLTTLTMTADQLVPIPPGQVQNELTEATILRSVFSRQQLFQRTVEFWTDHFNIDINNGIDRSLKLIDDRDVIRAHALGTFAALIDASAHSPAMLYYLDNYTNTVGNPNENYARELMELHTMGVDGGYTQQDVQEVARCFTGWALYNQNSGANSWHFRFNNAQHDNGAKTVLGNVINAGGINDGLAVLDILVNHPSTAHFIATKLCRWFYAEDPPATLIDSVATTYSGTGGDIKAMIRTIFDSVDPAAAPLKFKRPYHLYMSALRATGATVNTINGLRQNLLAAGQLPFAWSPPDGYPDRLDAWSGLLLPRWNFGASMVMTNGVAGVVFSPTNFFTGATTIDQLMDRIDDALFGGFMDSDDKLKIRTFLNVNPAQDQRRREAVGLAIAAPSYQWY
ncbi:MAG: DUF1800 domain-containing protein [Phycisphaerales bacterium]|nr:DUF1800 domain-containing protein [Phycisphaerales bacterium]